MKSELALRGTSAKIPTGFSIIKILGIDIANPTVRFITQSNFRQLDLQVGSACVNDERGRHVRSSKPTRAFLSFPLEILLWSFSPLGGSSKRLLISVVSLNINIKQKNFNWTAMFWHLPSRSGNRSWVAFSVTSLMFSCESGRKIEPINKKTYCSILSLDLLSV